MQAYLFVYIFPLPIDRNFETIGANRKGKLPLDAEGQIL